MFVPQDFNVLSIYMERRLIRRGELKYIFFKEEGLRPPASPSIRALNTSNKFIKGFSEIDKQCFVLS